MDYKVFGCKTNKYFAEKWLAHPHLEDKKWYFIASCVVTDKAKAKWVKHALRKLKTLKDDEKLFLSGCWNIRNWVVDPDFFKIYHELENFQEKIEVLPEDPSDFIMTEEEKKKMMLTKIRSLRTAKKQIFTRKYMVVQTGCDNFCTFCLTVQARGRHKWRPMEEILDEVHTFVRWWWKEIVLTGINLWAWWSESSNDFKMSKFGELVETILNQTEIERIRISSVWVEFFNDRIIKLFENPRIIAYVHLSIQSGSTKILAKMNRHYNRETTREVLTKLRNLKREDGIILNIWADIIAWFPDENEDDFADTFALIKDFWISQLHAFPFSGHIDHYNVPAGSFKNQVPNHISQARTKTLIAEWERQKRILAEKNIWKILSVLVEKVDKEKNTFSGWSENYLACNEKNFKVLKWQKIEKWRVIKWEYLHFIQDSVED